MKRTDDEDFDVHLIYDPSEAALAEAVRYRLSESGLTCDDLPAKLANGETFDDRLDRFLDTCRSCVVLMSRVITNNQIMLAECGASWARKMPIFVLQNDVRASDYSAFFKRFPAFRLWTGFPRLVKAIRKLPERVPA
jgi:hypothetical protein